MSTASATTSNRHVVIDSPIGPLTLVRDDDGFTGLYYPGHWTDPDQSTFGPRVVTTADPGFDETIAQLNEFFASERQDFDLPLNPQGSDRARRVWQLLAIGGFVGHNPLSIFIAGHRVVGSTGKLTGYAGGLERKQYLLELEKAIPVAPQALW